MSAAKNTKPAVAAAGVEPERKTVSKKSTTPGGDVKGLKIFDFDGASVRVVIRNGRNARTTPGGSASDRR